ncbi:MAG: biofilm protein TabA [Clostridium sp.]|jgi:biofilm protein TabA
MILDVIENINKYTLLNEGFKKAFKFLEENNVEELPKGKYEIDGDNVFILIQEYTSRDEKENKWESHKKYIDIQYVLKGSEVMGYKNILELNLVEDIFEEKDVSFYDEVENWTKLKVQAGEFAIFFPGDGHKPCCESTEPESIVKAVIKVKVY